MRNIYILILFSIFSLVSEAKTKVIYISSSTGKAFGIGTKKNPIKSIAYAYNIASKNAILKLKRGDIFFENIKGFKNTTIESYGNGEKPIICGFKILRDPRKWTYNTEGYWQLDLKNSDFFMGFKGEDNEQDQINNIGCIYDFQRDKLYGLIVKSKDKLKRNGDIFVGNTINIKELDKKSYRYLCFKSIDDPRKMGNLCFSMNTYGISKMDSCKIKDIAIVGFGCHGICEITNCSVENCLIDIIGGAVQIGCNDWVRFGNGIEFWISEGTYNKNSKVKNCIISRTYDCGSTIQGRYKAENILFENNKYIYCRQAFEHFLNPINKNISADYTNCVFKNNVAFMMGQNQFSSPEARDADLLSYEDKGNKNMEITGNRFFGSNYYCNNNPSRNIHDNKVYVYDGQYLDFYHGKNNYPTIFAKNSESISKYKMRTGDTSKIIIIKRGSKKDNKLRKYFLKLIGYKMPNLRIADLLNEK